MVWVIREYKVVVVTVVGRHFACPLAFGRLGEKEFLVFGGGVRQLEYISLSASGIWQPRYRQARSLVEYKPSRQVLTCKRGLTVRKCEGSSQDENSLQSNRADGDRV